MIKRFHYFSGLTMAVFVAFHLLNHLMLFQSERAHIEFMQTARKFYRNPISETILMSAVVIQIVSGIQLLRKKWKDQNDGYDKLRIYSGLFLAYFLIVHVSAILFGRYVLHLDTNLYFGASVLNNSPSQYYFVFHYGLAIIAFCTHIACAHKINILKFTSEKTTVVHAYILMGIGVILAFLIVYKMMGVSIPKEFQYLPFGRY